MSNKVTVTLDGRRYRIAAEEDPEYMLEIAEFVDGQLKAVRKGNVYRSGVDCATVTALNLADTLYKERASQEDLRSQLKEALDALHQAEARLRDYKNGQRGRSNNRKQNRGSQNQPNPAQVTLGGEDED